MGRCLFQISPLILIIFKVKSDDFSHAETGSGKRTLVVFRREHFYSSFKVEWKTVFEQNVVLDSGFCSCTAYWLCFKLFLASLLSGFRNAFIVHSWSCFYFVKILWVLNRICPAMFFHFALSFDYVFLFT